MNVSGGVVVGLTVQPVQAWKKARYTLFDWLIMNEWIIYEWMNEWKIIYEWIIIYE